MQFSLDKLNPFHPSYIRVRKWILRLISLSVVFLMLFMVLILSENNWDTERVDPSDKHVELPRMSPPFLLPPYAPCFNLLRLGGLKPQVAETIFLDNPSFENEASLGRASSGWVDCGAVSASPPDIQPGAFGVTTAPARGFAYAGLVLRDDGTWESIGQRLTHPLVKGKTYSFSLDLARSDIYLSISAVNRDSLVQYTGPAVLRVWGGIAYCDRKELLYQTHAIISTSWERYNLVFSPQNDHYEYFILEAYYHYPMLFPYCGNLLVDNCSEIRLVK